MKTFMNFLTENMTGKEQKDLFFQILRLIDELANIASPDRERSETDDIFRKNYQIQFLWSKLNSWQQTRLVELLQRDIEWRHEQIIQTINDGDQLDVPMLRRATDKQNFYNDMCRYLRSIIRREN